MPALAKARRRRLLLDEPSIGLAPTILEELQRVIVDIRKDEISMIVAEQNVWWVAPLAQCAYLLESGQLIASSLPEGIVQRERILESFLGEEGSGEKTQSDPAATEMPSLIPEAADER